MSPTAHSCHHDRTTWGRVLDTVHKVNVAARIAGAFERAGIDLMALKGLALNLTVYDDPSARTMGDLDLLIHPQDAERAREILEELGCLRDHELVREDFFPTFYYAMTYRDGDLEPVHLDIHVRPFRPLRFARTVPEDALWATARRVRLGATSIQVPAAEEMLVHLAVHLAIHSAARDAWRQDIRAWMATQAPDLSRVCDLARSWGVVAALHAGLRRAGVEIPAALSSSSRRIPWAERLATWHAPRDADRPLAKLAVDVVSTPGWRFVGRYVAALAIPDRGHMAEWYGRRHVGWLPCAHMLRWAAAGLGRRQGGDRWRPKMTTRTSVRHGVGVFALRDLADRELIGSFAGRATARRSPYVGGRSDQHHDTSYVEITGDLKFLNHSCRPNARLQGCDLVALHPIRNGEEITIDYGLEACSCARGSAQGARTHV